MLFSLDWSHSSTYSYRQHLKLIHRNIKTVVVICPEEGWSYGVNDNTVVKALLVGLSYAQSFALSDPECQTVI
jgi:hypothetical protein